MFGAFGTGFFSTRHPQKGAVREPEVRNREPFDLASVTRQMKMASRTRSVGTKVTEEEYARIQARASEEALSISEWCRSVVLKAARGDKPSPDTKTLLAEVLGLRVILLNLHYAVSQNQSITADDMQAIIDRADKEKAKRVEERLLAGPTRGL